MTESHLLQSIRLALGRVPGVTLFRNNVGALKSEDGRLVKYGLVKGSSDLIGWVTRPECGCARFLALEVKSPTGQPTPEQLAFLAAVRNAGGIAGIVRSADDAIRIVGEHH